jgi:hypothetical protein|tara:strand:+ start:4243 stop:4947 length:705 start_codon:yes stop_codon:yes gene_type:complete
MPHWKKNWPVTLSSIEANLYAFGTVNDKSGRTYHSYFLTQKGGNTLFHGPDNQAFFDEFADFFEEHGGIRNHLFTHAPETSKAGCKIPMAKWNTTNWLSELDLPHLRREVKDCQFKNPKTSGRWITNVRSIPLPGHMPGFTGYLVKSGGKSYLISGDFIIVGAGGRGWRAPVPSERLSSYALSSIETVRKLRFDAFLPNGSITDIPVPWSASEKKEEILDGGAAFVRKKFRIKD